MSIRLTIAVGITALAGRASAAPVTTEPWAGVVWTDAAPPAPGADLPRLLFLDRCPAEGCVLHPGHDDSRTNTSSLAGQPLVLPGWTRDDATWNATVACVKRTYAWFDITVTDVDPGPSVPHFEVMFGGKAVDLLNDAIPWNALGVSPFDCSVIPNAITFVFDEFTTAERLCSVTAQESAHAFGLDHELLPSDPMTYLAYAGHREFRDEEADCGESAPRQCWCGGTSQNSFQSVMAVFGPAAPTPPTIHITEPPPGAQVQPGFPIRVEMSDDYGVERVDLVIDGEVVATRHTYDDLIAPPAIARGEHQLTVRAYDPQGASGEDAVSIDIVAACTQAADCGTGRTCVGGRCVAGPGTQGGLGEACTGDTACASAICASDGDDHLCAEPCALDGTDCPDGFSCHGPEGLCWPVPVDDTTGAHLGGGGGCAAGDGAPGAPIGLGLAFAALLAGRRRRRPRA